YMTGKLLLKLDTVKHIILNQKIFGRLNSTPDALFQSDAVKYAFIGLMRDLRGIAMSANSRRAYGFLFDWLYPAHMPILMKGLVHYADVPEVLCKSHRAMCLNST
ncbi:exportin-7-like, partial [Trifolium medium]|nr:exportin-7-like [Trifolium medium]